MAGIVGEVFATQWLGFAIESGSVGDGLVFRQGGRRLRVEIEFEAVPAGLRSVFVAPDSVAALTDVDLQAARLLVPAGAPHHEVAAELAGAVVRWFAESRWVRFGRLVWRADHRDVLARDVCRGR